MALSRNPYQAVFAVCGMLERLGVRSAIYVHQDEVHDYVDRREENAWRLAKNLEQRLKAVNLTCFSQSAKIVK